MNVRCWIVLALMLASCSAPKYSYYFDYQQYPAKVSDHSGIIPASTLPDVPSESYSASLNEGVVQTPQDILIAPPVSHARAAASPSIQPVIKGKAFNPTPPPAKTIHADLKRSIIFVILGIGLLIVGTEVFTVIGSLSLIIGIIFGIKWLLR